MFVKYSVQLFIFAIFIFLYFNCNNPEKTDTTPPVCSIQSPASGETVFEIVKIRVSTSDNDGIERVEYFVDDSLVFTDQTSPYVYHWNCTIYPDNSEHIIKAISYDNSGNFTQSQPVLLTVMNASSKPIKINIESIEYDLSQMEIIWEKTLDTDFDHYTIYHSLTDSANKLIITSIYDSSIISHTISQFNPRIENWYWVSISDSVGLETLSEAFKVIDSPPASLVINPIIFDDYEFIISWSESKDNDFHSYKLYELDYNDSTIVDTVYTSQNRNITEFTITNINYDERRLYRINAIDIWNLSSKSNIEIASSYQQIVFSSYLGNNSLCLMDFDGYNRRTLLNSLYVYLSSFFPDGLYLLFVQSHKIFRIKIDGSELIELASTTLINAFPDISNDGSKITFIAPSLINATDVVWTMNADGQNQVELTQQSGAWKDNHPIFSPDMSKIVYEHDPENEIWIIDSDGNNPTPLATARDDGMPNFSPDGSKIVFVSGRNLIPGTANVYMSEIYIMNSDGSNQTRFTFNTANRAHLNPKFSPNGDKILYNCYDGLMVMNVDGSGSLKIEEYWGDLNANFTPDGLKIIYDYIGQIYICNIDGTNKIQLTSENYNFDASVQPRP